MVCFAGAFKFFLNSSGGGRGLFRMTHARAARRLVVGWGGGSLSRLRLGSWAF
jgi:hypothetical protein